MMERTTNLRFTKRQVGKDVYRILQQQWVDDDPPDEGATISEWRDVPPEEDETEGYDPANDRMTR